MQDYDPFGFSRSFHPAPVPGETHPPVRLIEDAEEEEDAQLQPGAPLWVRMLAGSLLLTFFLNIVLVTLATAGAFSPLTHAGDWQRFSDALPQPAR